MSDSLDAGSNFHGQNFHDQNQEEVLRATVGGTRFCTKISIQSRSTKTKGNCEEMIQYLLHPYNPRNQQHPETDSILYKIISPAFKITQILPIGECSFNLCTEW